MYSMTASVNAIDETLYQTLKGRLTTLKPSQKILQMADGQQIPLVGVWKGKIKVKGIEWEAIFKVLKSNSTWEMLFGKPLLKIFNAVHDYKEDTIQIPQVQGAGWATLKNQYTDKQGFTGKLLANLMVDIKQLITVSQPISMTVTRIVTKMPRTDEQKKQNCDSKMYKLCGGLITPLKGSSIIKPCDVTEPHVADTIISPDISVQEQITGTSEED